MSREFIITEADIDAALDLLLELTPKQVKRIYPNLMRRYRDKSGTGNENEKKVALAQMKSMRREFPELKLPKPPTPKVPAKTGTRDVTKTGEKKAKAGQALTPDQQEIITQAEVTPEKKKSGNYDVVTIGDKEYDRNALKVAIRNVEKKTETLPPDERKTQQYNVAIIKKKIETPPEPEYNKPVEADVDIHDMAKTAKGYVSVVDNFTWKGGATSDTVKRMDVSANAAFFMEMTFVGQIIDAVIKAGNSLVVEQNNLESFFAKHVEPSLRASFKDLTSKMNKMSDSAPDTDVTKKLFDEIAKQLKDKKKTLEKNPKLTKKFNKVKEEYSELMVKQFAKSFEKKPEEEKETLTEEKLLEVTIDFSEIKRKNQHLDESFLVMFGGWVKWLLGKMFGGGSIPGTVKGSRSEVESFARAMASEKGYIETAKRYGLDHPTTYKSKARLSSATSGFEKATGIKWPFE